MAPKSKEEKKCVDSCCSAVQNTSVFVLPRTSDPFDMDLVQLKHPASGKPASFLITNTDSKVYELLTFSNKYRSYFVGSSVKSDGKMYITTPIDPLFLLLPYLSTSVHCSPLEQLLRDDEFPQAERLAHSPALIKNLHKISDEKGVSVLGYKYNEEKTLSWLVEKVQRAAKCLISNSVTVTTSDTVQSNNYVKKSSLPTHITEDYLRLGFGLVCEYLTSELSIKLQGKLGLSSDNKEESAGKRTRTPDRANSTDTKRSKPADQTDFSPPSSRQTTPTSLNGKTGGSQDRSSAKQKARAKAAVGSKSISSFFSKTPASASN